MMRNVEADYLGVPRRSHGPVVNKIGSIDLFHASGMGSAIVEITESGPHSNVVMKIRVRGIHSIKEFIESFRFKVLNRQLEIIVRDDGGNGINNLLGSKSINTRKISIVHFHQEINLAWSTDFDPK